MDPTNGAVEVINGAQKVVEGVNPTVALFVDKFEQFLKGAQELGGQAWNEMVPVFKQVFEIYSRQSVAYGISEMVTSILVIAFCALLVTFWWRGRWNPLQHTLEERNKLTEGDAEAEAAWFGIWGLPGGLMCLIITFVIGENLCAMADYLRHIINPQFYAIQDLTEVIKNIKP